MITDSVKVAVTLDDGQLAIMTFITKGRGDILPYGATWSEMGVWTRAVNDENIFAEICRAFPGQSDQGTALPKAVKYRVMSTDEMPADRTYRNAWKDSGSAIEHDMIKAREIHRDLLREARAPLLLNLDVAYSKADEKNDATAKADVAVKKQALRDVTKHPDIESATTIEDLKKIWPL